MKQVVRMFGIAGAVIVCATLNAAAQTASLKSDVVKDLTAQKDTLAKLAEAMPENKYTFKATPAERDFAAQVMHVAQINVMLGGMLGGKATAPTIDQKATKKADVVKAMNASFDYAIALANEQTDQSMVGTIDAKFMGPSTRARIFYFIVSHSQDVYGQMVVYARLNGVTPPASQRP